MQLQIFKILVILLIICLVFINESYTQQVTRKKCCYVGNIKQPRGSKSKKNSPRVDVPKPKGPRYAKTPITALPDTIIDRLVTWKNRKYRDILNHNRKVTNQYKGGIYIERIRNGLVRYSPVHKLIEATLRPRK